MAAGTLKRRIRNEGEILGGRYEILRHTAAGGLSQVYRVKNIETGREWALKEYLLTGDKSHDTMVIRNVRTEAEALNRLKIRGVPYIRDLFETDEGSYVIVMDFMEGRTLSSTRHVRGTISPEDVRNYMVQLSRILERLHSAKPQIVYRDIKPSNVMLLKDGTISLIDFGTMREYEKGLNRDRHLMGTDAYSSPEQLGNIPGQTDGRSDIYSVGVTIYELLTGNDPTTAREKIAKEVIKEASKPRGKYSPMREGLLRIAEKCIKKDPDERFQTAAELTHALIHASSVTSRKARTGAFGTITLITGNGQGRIHLHHPGGSAFTACDRGPDRPVGEEEQEA